MIELRHLRYFMAVAEELHFGRPARRLHMAQSPLSHQIRQLEADLGVELIHRSHAVVGLTDAGAVFLEDARTILDHVERAGLRARRAARGQVGVLRVGYVAEVTADLLPLGLRAFGSGHPDVELDLTEGTTGALLDRLRAGTIDVAVVRSPWSLGDLCFERLVAEPLVLAAPAGAATPPGAHRLADLADVTWVLPARQATRGLRLDIDAAFEQAGVRPRSVLEASSLTAVLMLVAGEAGWALVPHSVARRHPVPGVCFSDLADPAPRTSAGMAWRSADRSTLVAGFVEAVRAAGHGHLGPPPGGEPRPGRTDDPPGPG